MAQAEQKTVTEKRRHWELPPFTGKLVLAIVMAAGVVLLLLYLAGVFSAKVPVQSSHARPKQAAHHKLAEVRRVRRPRSESAVGTVRAVHEAAVASKLLAKVVEVKVKAGQAVERNEVLARLEDADLQARLKQVQANLVAVKATLEKAKADYERAKRLIKTQAISKADFDQARAASEAAAADLERAKQAVREAKVTLDYATIRAPITGVVIDKRVEAGDTVTPGKVLLTLYDPTRMQMVVTVRESLAQRLKVGQKIPGRLEALDYDCEATISEIVPETQTASRSFTVKVTGPCPPGVYSGMFGRIFIPLEDEEVTVVPAAAIRKVGQLDMVDVAVDGAVQRRSIRLGRKLDDNYEVLSGLAAGEKVVVPTSGKEDR